MSAHCGTGLTAVSSSEDRVGSPGCRVWPCWEVECLHSLCLTGANVNTRLKLIQLFN